MYMLTYAWLLLYNKCDCLSAGDWMSEANGKVIFPLCLDFSKDRDITFSHIENSLKIHRLWETVNLLPLAQSTGFCLSSLAWLPMLKISMSSRVWLALGEVVT